ncbi:MAG: hypothetical protein M1337_05715 [Actinobacteria bacterium]|nr:hypothetical protein [Actinomycetota bacterium]
MSEMHAIMRWSAQLPIETAIAQKAIALAAKFLLLLLTIADFAIRMPSYPALRPDNYDEEGGERRP